MKNEMVEILSEYFHAEFANIIREKLVKGHALKSFNINPVAIAALTGGVLGSCNAKNAAKALIYPRVFGTSINTTFGDMMQRLCTNHLGALASSTQGMDIEFTNKVNGERIIMQLKAGPNTINAGDAKQILHEMQTAHRLFIQNRSASVPTFAIGITYGSMDQISGHYKKIHESAVGNQPHIPVYVGTEFWHILTGDRDFYRDMIQVVTKTFENEDYSALLEKDISLLANEIESKCTIDGIFDLGRL